MPETEYLKYESGSGIENKKRYSIMPGSDNMDRIPDDIMPTKVDMINTGGGHYNDGLVTIKKSIKAKHPSVMCMIIPSIN